MTSARQLAKQRLIAHAFVVAKIYEKVGLDIKLAVREMLDKKMTEHEMVESVSIGAVSAMVEAPLVELWDKLAAFEVADR